MKPESIESLLHSSRVAIMGVVNTTPDSFSDGGKYLRSEHAIAHALKLVDEGADILDIGGESTRPGALAVADDEELNRVIPVIEALASRTPTPISVDTSKPTVMRAAVAAGATLINDVNALRSHGALAVAADTQTSVCVMHMLGEPRTMQQQPTYFDAVDEVCAFLLQRVAACTAAGISQAQIIVDPGIGFGKTLTHNLQLLKAVNLISRTTDCPVMVGVSRKSMIDQVLGRPVEQRLAGSLGLAVQAALNGARILRVHDVAATHDAVRCVEAVLEIT